MHRWSLSFGKTACAGASPVAGSLNSRDRNPSIPEHQGRRRSFQYGGATGMDGAGARGAWHELPGGTTLGGDSVRECPDVSPEDELRICATGRCRAAYRLVSRAFDVHPETQATVGPWTRAVIVLEDGNGVEIHNSSGQILACA